MRILDEKIQNLRATLVDLKQGSESDAKSSAGDKHETALAMMQIEYEKISKQLDELEKQKNNLDKIDLGIHSTTVRAGSLIKANNTYMFLSTAIGKITVDDISVMVFSPQSPIGMKILGHKAGDSVQFNGVNYLIEEVS